MYSPMNCFYFFVVVVLRFILVDMSSCSFFFSLQYTIVLYECIRIYLSSVPLMGVGSVFSFF